MLRQRRPHRAVHTSVRPSQNAAMCRYVYAAHAASAHARGAAYTRRASSAALYRWIHERYGIAAEVGTLSLQETRHATGRRSADAHGWLQVCFMFVGWKLNAAPRQFALSATHVQGWFSAYEVLVFSSERRWRLMRRRQVEGSQRSEREATTLELVHMILQFVFLQSRGCFRVGVCGSGRYVW